MGKSERESALHPSEEKREEVTTSLFAQNMVDIGRIVSRHGTTPLGYAGAPIRFLESCEDESQGFRAEVYVDSDDPYMVLVKRGAPRQGLLLPYYDHTNINYRPDTRIGLRVEKEDHPESVEFEKPDNLPPGNIFNDHGKAISFWMRSAMLGPKTVAFLETITAEALGEFEALDQAKNAMIPSVLESF